ncbi:MAG: 50S ribosomal protein L13 [Gemmatimonadetes bacterium]|uniref:Large ribosomal subunit protein uL13 n=1 Tax=Candidatus Kutchimonas denitrificans TaxID=3056748 RepID=A0AAE5CA95_9BACT|nr:50S ribosomal protein L13 [Gemmatimonadota bacterium]NIR76246.1 50S ribosomal protein L13 [Candidatus Kutchimonas denitrificans]NIS00686.1 50S ribosomal protein L13 [Gemmatimonadota bacterium]NIT66831.1 50S ribosomal protein L13 [Gemmatimonadota bacterium]NIV23430.1 50S ribosomal protein L13 [Gemmatimonadota bacterium]
MAELRTQNQKTIVAKPSDVERAWYHVDADGVVLGRLAARVAHVLRGKHKPTYTPHVDCGDGVIVVNAEKVRLTGRKPEQKAYFRHSGYVGGAKLIPFKQMQERKPEWIIKRAVQGMLPKTTLGRQMLKKLRVYAGPEHPHKGLQTEPLEVKS